MYIIYNIIYIYIIHTHTHTHTHTHNIYTHKHTLIHTHTHTHTRHTRTQVKDDPFTELEKKQHKQWFYFRAAGALKGVRAHFTIVNAGETSYPEAWPETTVVYSYDRKEWKRCQDTRWDSGAGLRASG